MTNRIADCSETETQPKPLASTKAYQVFCWRCPACSVAQLAERSSSHVEACKGCGAECNIVVRAAV